MLSCSSQCIKLPLRCARHRHPTPAADPLLVHITHPLFSDKHIHTLVSQQRSSSLTGPLSLVAGHDRFHCWSNRTILVQSHTCLPDSPTHSFCWSWSKAGGNYRSKTLPKVEHGVISLYIYIYIYFFPQANCSLVLKQQHTRMRTLFAGPVTNIRWTTNPQQFWKHF